MPGIVTVLEAHVAPERQADLRAAYRAAARGPVPRGLVRSALFQGEADPTLWRIETLWASRESLEAMRGQGTPRGVLMFREAGSEPTLTLLHVMAELTPA